MYSHNRSHRMVLLYWSCVRQTKHIKCLTVPRVSELLLHRCCLQGVTASDRRGSAVNSTPKTKLLSGFFFCFVNHCAALFVCSQTATVFPSLTLLSIYIPYVLPFSSRFSLQMDLYTTYLEFPPPLVVPLTPLKFSPHGPPSAHPPSPWPHYLSRTRVI